MDSLSPDIARKLLNRGFANLAQRVHRGGDLSRSERAMLQGKLNLQIFCFSAICGGMKATLQVTGRGVVSLPAKMRSLLGIRGKDVLVAETTPEGILLRPAVTLPVELYTPERIKEFDAEEAALAKALKRKKR
jgi:bifunctional DNA-binding transcriptional regulator/antitoxin component of YhaV-PrlF toxin-antitoxin module